MHADGQQLPVDGWLQLSLLQASLLGYCPCVRGPQLHGDGLPPHVDGLLLHVWIRPHPRQPDLDPRVCVSLLHRPGPGLPRHGGCLLPPPVH
mmetsp:Transcript_21181/g.54235  ORF Transcript_21181/g.54235 Transcript_21181/m.54235 type:complete len:92 (-) Transcript_21181:1018-1293(-)